jgi:hypothetical protein
LEYGCDDNNGQIRTPALFVPGTVMTLAEATDKILFCNSIMHDLVYAAVAISDSENATENEKTTTILKPTSSLDYYDLAADRTQILGHKLWVPKFSSCNDLKDNRVGNLSSTEEVQAIRTNSRETYALNLLSSPETKLPNDELLMMSLCNNKKLNSDDGDHTRIEIRIETKTPYIQNVFLHYTVSHPSSQV